MQTTLGPSLIRSLQNKINNCSGNGESVKASDCASGKAMNPASQGFV